MRTKMLAAWLGGVLLLGAGCGGGGGAAPAGEVPSDGLSAQELLESCVAGELQDLSTLLAVIQNLLDDEGTGLTPQFDILRGLLTGTFPWTLDLDGNDIPDLEGTLNLTDPDGGVVPPSQIGDLLDALDGDLSGLDAFFAALPDGTAVNLTFVFADLFLRDESAGASGDGTFSVSFSGGEPTSASGDGRFSSGDCSFDFGFDDIDVARLDPATPGMASAFFELVVGDETLSGSVALDGSNVATITVDRGTGPESFTVDLTTGAVTPLAGAGP